MKVSKIRISNLLGVEQLELDGSPVELVGKKGAGKTSVLDAIKLALTNQSERDYVIKKGETEGSIFISIDSGIEVERIKSTEKSDKFQVLNEGKKITSPQGFLNGIFTTLQLNPIEFASWPKEKQNSAILDLVEFEWTPEWIMEQFGELPKGVDLNQHILKVLSDIQGKNGYYWKERESANREELYKRQTAEEMARNFPAGYKSEDWKNYPLSEKMIALNDMQDKNSQILQARGTVETFEMQVNQEKLKYENAISNIKWAEESEIERIKNQIERLKKEIEAAEVKADSDVKIANSDYENKVQVLKDLFENSKALAEQKPVDTSELSEEITQAVAMKEMVSEYETMMSMRDECKKLKEKAEGFDSKIKLARSLPGQVLQEAKLPIENLTVEDGIPLLNGLPISNLSDGEKIELCVDIAIAQEKNLDLILLNGVEQLDDISRNIIYDKCKKAGVQVIAARTTNDDELTIIEL